MLIDESTSLDVEALLAEFASTGFARLGVVLSADGVERLRKQATDLMTGEEPRPGIFYQHDSASGRYADLTYGSGWVGPSLAYRKLEHLELTDAFREWIENPLFARIARTALGESVSLYRAVLWNKAAMAGTELPWHQDDGRFWGIDRPPSLQIWTALDDAPQEAGCLEVIPGTHLEGLASPEGGTVQASSLDAIDVGGRAIKLPTRSGEAILIHNHLWHRSDRNRTANPRRALSISYLDGATRCLRRRRAPRTFVKLFQAKRTDSQDSSAH
jgi:hypothetical protein